MTDALLLVQPEPNGEYDLLAALWISRLALADDTVLRKICRGSYGSYCEEVRSLLGISVIEGPLPASDVRKLLKKSLTRFVPRFVAGQSILIRNIGLLSQLVPLNEVAQHILAFCALSQQHSILCEIFSCCDASNANTVLRTLSQALAIDSSEIKRAISSRATLIEQRLLYFDQDSDERNVRLSVMPELFKSLFTSHSSIDELMACFIECANEPSLVEEDFSHLQDETKLLKAYLAEVKQNAASGVNILIYGPPGTGKTEYVKWLAEHLNQPLYAVKSVDEYGNAMSAGHRLMFYQFCQQFLANTDALVLFDEVEDVISASQHWLNLLQLRSGVKTNKAWLNKLLETNPVPAIWVSNYVGDIDPAYLRRFDFSFEIGVPPLATRKYIINKYLHAFNIPPHQITELAQQPHLSPAQIEKAAKLLKASGKTGKEAETRLGHVIKNSMALLAQPIVKVKSGIGDSSYSLDYLNTDCDLKQLLQQLQGKHAVHANMVFYGASGAGKTALAYYIAEVLNKQLLLRRASDVLDPFVGGTERNIAHMFEQAQRDDAVLLLDEADSLLAERNGAWAHWQVTQVNEMLAQMESFAGLFICSTNLWILLDQATLRRFTFKIKFHFLRSEQRIQLLAQHVSITSQAQQAHYQHVLSQLTNLTPGDFANVRQQAEILGIKLSGDEFLHRLRLESQSKANSRSAIGFIH